MLLLPVVFLSIFTAWIIWGNLSIKASYYELSFDRLPDEFEGYTIAQISDLHNAEFGIKNNKLLSLLSKANPDIIVITGDIIYKHHTDISVAASFVEQAVKIAPVYYVTGNHEASVLEIAHEKASAQHQIESQSTSNLTDAEDEYHKLEQKMVQSGVHILHGESKWIERNSKKIQIVGIDDPDYYDQLSPDEAKSSITSDNIGFFLSSDIFTILLSHRPELFEQYVDSNVDLVFTGHAHGGQFRLPFLGGVFAPHQGFFPKYDAGIFQEKQTTMIVSRGIGNSVIPVRINNRPEIVIVQLHS